MSFIKHKFQNWMLLPLLLIVVSCAPQEPVSPIQKPVETSIVPTDQIMQSTVSPTLEVHTMTQTQFPNVLSVQVTGNPGAYQFAVELASPDTGCEQYADWWEVVSADGELLYRRILLHSHVDEQPFTRSGGPVEIDANTTVYVRAHMNTTGYGGKILTGTVRDGFEPAEVEAGFGSGLERDPPQPEDCAF
jgi:hypothetical protein